MVDFRAPALVRALALVGATIVALLLIIVAAIPCYVCVSTFEHAARFQLERFPRELVSDAYDTLRTGDVVLFESTGHISRIIVTKTYFGHVGVVLRSGDGVYISETGLGSELMPDPAAPGQNLRLRKGVDLVPFLIRVKYYPGEVFLARQSPPLNEAQAAALWQIATAWSPYPNIFDAALHMVRSPVLRSRTPRHCFQHVAHALSAVGALAGERVACLDSAQAVCEWAKRPVRLVYDLDAPKYRENSK